MSFSSLFKSLVLVCLLSTAAVALLAIGFVAKALVGMESPAEVVATLRHNSFALTSEVFDSEGTKIGEFAGERRYFVPLSAIPQHVIDAFLAVEDGDFYHHRGVSPKAILRALWANARGQRLAQGASTISQQLVRTYFLTREKTWERKLREVVLSLAVERRMSKDEILELYLNKIFLGNHSYGIEAASRNYFRKRVGQLNVAEAALLASLPKAPSWLAPHRHYDRALARKNHVLALMHRRGQLSDDAYKTWRAHQIYVAPEAQASQRRAPYFVDAVRHALSYQFELQELPHQGLKIKTTLHEGVHAAAKMALRQAIAGLDDRDGPSQEEIQGASVTMDLKTGAVLSLIGGEDFFDSQFNRAIKTKRQVGHVFIPFYLGYAFDRGMTLDHRFSVRSSTNKFLPPAPGPTLYEAMVYDQPYIAARVYPSMGHGTMRSFLGKLGFRFAVDDLSLAVGYGRATPLEVIQAASSFATDGRVVVPYFVQTMTRERGEPFYEGDAGKGQRVMSEASAYIVRVLGQHTLRYGSEFGRQAAADGFGAFAGVTEDQQNAWLVGFNRHLVTVMWVGSERGRRRVGSSLAPVKHELHRALLTFADHLPAAYRSPGDGVSPAGVSFARLPQKFEGTYRTLPFLVGSEPSTRGMRY